MRETEAPGWDERDNAEYRSCDGDGEAKFEMENVENQPGKEKVVKEDFY